MRNEEINQIIENYKPHEGFYDLSEKPETLTKIEYAKILYIQEFLIGQNKNIEYLKKFDLIQYEKDKEMSANLQGIIREHWGDTIYK